MNQSPTISRLKALADPTRLRLLALLEGEELSVGELTNILGMTQSRVSGHLGVLRETGLVRDRRQGTSAYYSLTQGEPVATWRAIRQTAPAPAEEGKDAVRRAEVLERRRPREREFFDRVAASWDEGRSESLGAFAGSFALAGLIPERLSLLDLGTGTGPMLPLLARHVDRVVAVDMSAGMLDRARKRVRAAQAGSVLFVRGDGTRLPLPLRAVDGVVANMILHHLLDPQAALREMSRVLKPGGRGVVVDFESHEERRLLEEEGHRWAGFDPAQLAAWCVDAGLTIPDYQRIPTPSSGRWSRLHVFVARFGRANSGARPNRRIRRT